MQPDPASAGKRQRHFWRICALYTFFGALALFLLTEHRAHVIGLLPFLLLAACPLMHVFMHRHHHRHVHADPGPPEHGHHPTAGAGKDGGEPR